MYVVTAKAGLLFVVVMALLSTTQTEPVTDMIVVFLANGVIPGTNLILPPEAILVTVALALMLVAALFFRGYTKYQARMRALIPNYDDRRHDPPFSALVPGLGRFQAAIRAARFRAIDASLGLNVWARYAGRPASVQAVTTRNTVNILMRTDRWAPVAVRFRLARPRVFASGAAAFRKLGFRLRAYLVRVTML